MAKQQTKPRVAEPVKKFFEAHPDEIVKIYRLMNATGFDEKQIRSAISYARTGGYPLEVITRGQAWIYRSNPIVVVEHEEELEEETQESAMRTVYDGVTDDEKGFYMINTSKDGLPVIQRDFDGTIWIAHPV